MQADGFWGESQESIFLVSGQPLVWTRNGRELGEARIGRLPVQPGECRFEEGDRFFLLETGGKLGAGWREKVGGRELPVLGMEETGILEQVSVGERVLLDDGRVVAVVEEKTSSALLCQVHAVGKPRVRSGKGVAFPDTHWNVAWPLDEAVLGFALEHGDAVGVSFVGCAADVDRVGSHLAGVAASGGRKLGLIVKLETVSAMAHLEQILFSALRYEPVGLMIARGDLAVELSYERLAEVQEEILCLGEAGHIPVIWATQVLENMARSGVPTRAEVTDAAMGMRAECVMLNRGRRLVGAVRLLAGIIRRMESHQFKGRQIFPGGREVGPETKLGAF
jgi:pyruvate kinase